MGELSAVCDGVKLDMKDKAKSLSAYDRRSTAERYRRTGGFAAGRKERLYEATLDLLTGLTAEGGVGVSS